MAVNVIYKNIPTIALRGIVLFPGMRFHFDVGRKKSIAAVKAAMNNDQKIFLITQKDISVNDPTPEELYKIGVIASIKQVIKAPETDFMRVIVECICRASAEEFVQTSPHIIAIAKEKRNSSIRGYDPVEKEALIRKTKDVFERFNIDFFNVSRGMVSVMAGIKEIPIWCNFTYDIANDKIVGEFRARDTSIVHIAKKYGGGGHDLACGATLLSWDEVDNVIKDFDDLLGEL